MGFRILATPAAWAIATALTVRGRMISTAQMIAQQFHEVLSSPPNQSSWYTPMTSLVSRMLSRRPRSEGV
jgi:hypothetical protein